MNVEKKIIVIRLLCRDQNGKVIVLSNTHDAAIFYAKLANIKQRERLLHELLQCCAWEPSKIVG